MGNNGFGLVNGLATPLAGGVAPFGLVNAAPLGLVNAAPLGGFPKNFFGVKSAPAVLAPKTLLGAPAVGLKNVAGPFVGNKVATPLVGSPLVGPFVGNKVAATSLVGPFNKVAPLGGKFPFGNKLAVF